MSVTRERAADLALAEANRIFGFPTADDELIILHKYTTESEGAWAFTYNTRSSRETGDILQGLMGNGPIVVEKSSGRVQPMSSLFTCEEALEIFETGECKAKPKLSPAELAEICLAVNPWWPGQPEEQDGLPPCPPQYTRQEWADYHRDPCSWCIKELRNPDRSVRCNAADILRGLARDAELAIPALVEGFQDADEIVRGYCVHALVDIGHAVKERAIAAVAPLTALLRDSNSDVRSLAVAALGAIGPAAASSAPELRRLLNDPDQETREQVASALRQLEASE